VKPYEISPWFYAFSDFVSSSILHQFSQKNSLDSTNFVMCKHCRSWTLLCLYQKSIKKIKICTLSMTAWSSNFD